MQIAARENGLLLKREVLSQRVWGTSSSFRVINIRIVFFLNKELEKSHIFHMFLRDSTYLNHGFKKVLSSNWYFIKVIKILSEELCFCVKLWVGALDCEADTYNEGKLSWPKEKSGSQDILIVINVPNYPDLQHEKPLKHKQQKTVWSQPISYIQSDQANTRRTYVPMWFCF